jgi:hypothetical protein
MQKYHKGDAEDVRAICIIFDKMRNSESINEAEKFRITNLFDEE